ncbi:MAG TPA: pre-peptidase C-terminal domain-containing protein [Rudaea sp.]
MDRWNQEFYHHGAAFASTQPSGSAGALTYGGGVSGVGVGSGQVKVYIVFYGTQWGTSSTDANGNLAFTGDSYGAASAVQQMFKGIGTNNETWQADLTQWCDGPNVANGASSCPSNASFVPYQTNVVAGVWYDNSAASPSSATGTQLAQEAIKAAAHFDNTATGSNRYTYYIILSPHGTNPDNYQSPTQGYCAWHDYTGDGYGVTAPGGDLAFSNQPYNMDMGSSCGVGFVNGSANGKLDGYTMTLGHEWHEMMSDMFPAGGWTNHTGGSYNGQENSDECAWLSPGTAGGAANVAFSTGTFAEQASWSNDTANCAISHAILTHGGGTGGTPTANFSFTTNGLAASFTDTSTDSGGTIGTHSWTFGDGGTSTTANPSHTYAAAGTYSVTETVADSVNTSATNSTTKSVTVTSSGGGGNTLTNGVAVTGLSGTSGMSSVYTFTVPAGATNVSIAISGGTGDADLYVKAGSAPTLSSYDCRPYLTGNNETCGSLSAGVTYYVSLNAYAAYSGVSLVGNYTTGGGGGGGNTLTNGVPVTGLSGTSGTLSADYTLTVPSGKTSVTIKISGGSGDADLYVKLNAAPTLSSYDCRPYITGNNETCTFTPPSAGGTYHVKLNAYSTYSGVSLTGSYN